ncbi:MAG TPA: arginine--tRNA ligase [Solirubrobacterales bacterium]
MATSLFDYFDDIAAEQGARARWAPRAPYQPEGRFDLMLVPRVRGWEEDPESLADLERFAAEPWVESVDRGGRQVVACLDSGWIERTGEGLERAAERGGHVEIAAGRRFALNFWDANSTKALHIGHLRNLALGNALGGAFEEAGGKVERRSIICDVGRSMGEAMAGVLQSGRHAEAWPEGGQKSDHFVGYCYADYVKSGRRNGAGGEGDPEDSLARELDLRNDSADQLLQRVLDGDQQAIELWSKTRAWVISGQRKTLARLGIAFDRVFFESDFLPEVDELAELGLREELLQRCPDGAVLYRTGREELDEMALLRADGLPTQHMRALAYWTAAPGLDEEMTSIQICGAEWVAHVTCRRKLMAELAEVGGGNGTIHPKHDVFHEMVSKERQTIASSKKDALLIDDLAEWIDAELEGASERAEVLRRHPSPERIAPQVALGFFLMHPTGKRVDFEPDKLLEPEHSLGWDLARAQTRDEARANGGRAREELARDPEYRFAVVQSEMYGRHLRQAVEKLDVMQMARFASHLSRWQLERERDPHVERVTQAVLESAARALGLEATR